MPVDTERNIWRCFNLCLYPNKSVKFQTYNNQTGELETHWRCFFNANSKLAYSFAEKVKDSVIIDIPCGKCYECLQSYSKEWSYRCYCESFYHDESCFITLTYKDSPVTLVKKDYQLFLKRLRKKIYPKKIKYFACGEYGSKGKRPHYHLIIFGYRPPDLEFFFNSGNDKIYKSKVLAELWSLGFVSVGDVSLNSAKYCAKYLQKLSRAPAGCIESFTAMSKGIGERYYLDNFEKLKETDKIYTSSGYIKLPRYFYKLDNKYLLADSKSLENKDRRLNNALRLQRDDKQLTLKRIIVAKRLH